MNKFLSFKLSTLICLFAYLLIFAFVAPLALAQTMTNSSYILRMGNLNSISGKPTGANYKVSFTVGETGANLFSGTNYKVRAGFQYIYSIIPFRFTISNTFIDFGIINLNPGTPVLRTNLLTISNGSANGYQVTASENHNLRVNATGMEIPATTCDTGSCTPTASDIWTSSLTYGFGYRCDNITGTDCATGFSTSTFYKSFIASPSAVAVMSGANVGRTKVVQVTYKVNISGAQAAGLYTNIINYIATPTF